MNISLAQAKVVCDAALAKGRELELSPLAVAVLDSGGTLVCLMREDNASLLRPDIAIGKAWGTLGMGLGGRELQRRAQAAPEFVSSLAIMSGGRVVPARGGILIRAVSGSVLGAVGISGDTSDNDELCGVHGVVSADLHADTGEEQVD
jgi:uncharacterized protein GlcG (DUF336 family)